MCTGGKPGRSTAALASNACRTSATSRPYRATLSEAQTNGTTHTYMRAHTHTHNWIDTDTWQHTSPRPRSTTPSSLILAINDHKARVYLQTNIKPQQKMCIGEASFCQPQGAGPCAVRCLPIPGGSALGPVPADPGKFSHSTSHPKTRLPEEGSKMPNPHHNLPMAPTPTKGEVRTSLKKSLMGGDHGTSVVGEIGGYPNTTEHSGSKNAQITEAHTK